MKPPPPVMRTFILFSEFHSYAQQGPVGRPVGVLAALDTIRSIARGDKTLLDQGAQAALPYGGQALPHHQFPSLNGRKGARERIRHGADQAVDPLRRLAPVDAAVVGPAS